MQRNNQYFPETASPRTTNLWTSFQGHLMEGTQAQCSLMLRPVAGHFLGISLVWAAHLPGSTKAMDKQEQVGTQQLQDWACHLKLSYSPCITNGSLSLLWV